MEGALWAPVGGRQRSGAGYVPVVLQEEIPWPSLAPPALLPLLVLPLLAVGGGASDLSAEVQALIGELTHDHRAKALSAANGALASLESMVEVPVSTAALGWLHQALAAIYLFEDDEDAAHREWRLACAIDSAPASFHSSLPPEDKVGWAAERAVLTDSASIVAHVPSGATLYVDGREQAADKVSVKPGQHLVQMLGGSSPQARLVTLAAGGSTTVGKAPIKVTRPRPTSPKASTASAVPATPRPRQISSNKTSLSDYTIGSISCAMQAIEWGSFTMGTPDTEEGRYGDEGPQHLVTLSAFWMGATEVTQGQYQQITGQNPSQSSSCGSSCPVERVFWCDAVAFCNRLSTREGLKPAYQLPTGFALGMDGDTCNTRAKEVKSQQGADGYRLPTEAEWEYATRAGTATPYWSGSQESDLARVGWYVGNSGDHTHPVTDKGQDNGASPWGLYDVHGNVWEWVWDWYGGSYHSGDVTDTAGPPSGLRRVIRGGCYYVSASGARSGSRDSRNPGNRDGGLGFRLARSPAP